MILTLPKMAISPLKEALARVDTVTVNPICLELQVPPGSELVALALMNYAAWRLRNESAHA